MDQHYDEINLIDLFIVVLRRKWIVTAITCSTIVLAVFYANTLPNMYTATTRVLPPPSSNSGASALLFEGGGSNLLGALFGGPSATDTYVGILKSRTVMDRIIESFKLKELYGLSDMESTRSVLAMRTEVESSKNQIIRVSVEDHDPLRAAGMANMYVEELDRVNRALNVTSGHLKRVFLEGRLQKVERDLSESEVELREFQEKFKLVALGEQARVTIEGAARIKGEIVMAQTELEVLKKFGTEKNIEAIRLKSRIAELNNQLSKIELGYSNGIHAGIQNAAVEESNFYIPFNELPNLSLKYTILQREARIQEELFKMLTSQYELAKIEEAKDFNMIQVLDRASPPDRRSSPRPKLIVILFSAAGLLAGVMIAFLFEYFAKLRIEDRERYNRLIGSFGTFGRKEYRATRDL
jgi:uncharacterized protein involved in exopolysaccharide biosynthesis